MAYNYMDAMRSDIRDYIEETYDQYDWSDKDKVYESLNDDLWISDSVTGNGSGSYTFNGAEAKEYVMSDPDAIGYIRNMTDDFGYDAKDIAERFMDEDWEWFDVCIRCYLLGQVLGEVLDEEFDKYHTKDIEDKEESYEIDEEG